TKVSARLGTDATTFAAGSFTVDLTGIEAQTTGAVRWNPYLYTGGAWSQQDILSHAGALQTNLANILTKDALVNAGLATAGDDADLVSAGAALLATNYYL